MLPLAEDHRDGLRYIHIIFTNNKSNSTRPVYVYLIVENRFSTEALANQWALYLCNRGIIIAKVKIAWKYEISGTDSAAPHDLLTTGDNKM